MDNRSGSQKSSTTTTTTGVGTAKRIPLMERQNLPTLQLSPSPSPPPTTISTSTFTKIIDFSTASLTYLKENCFNLVNKLSAMQPDAAGIQKNNIGHFSLLPDELLMMVLKSLDVESLASFSGSNSTFGKFVVANFLLSKSGVTFLLRASQVGDPSSNREKLLELFTSIGFLIKKSTIVYPTAERITILLNVMVHSYGFAHLSTFDVYNVASLKLIFKFYGRMMNQLIKGWEHFECVKVYNQLRESFKIGGLLARFFKSSLGSQQKHELLIRFFYRMICNSAVNESFREKLRWIGGQLKEMPMEQIAKIFILIFGPIISTDGGDLQQELPFVAWWDLTDADFVKFGLEDLGLVLQAYYCMSADGNSFWSKEFVVDLLDRITTTPSRWSSLNVAMLLYHGGEKLALQFLTKKLINSFDHAVEYLAYLFVVTVKFTPQGSVSEKEVTAVATQIEVLVDHCGRALVEAMSDFFADLTHQLAHIDEDVEGEENPDDVVTLLDVIDAQQRLIRLQMLRIFYVKKYQ